LAAAVVAVADGAGGSAADPSGSPAEVQRVAVLVGGEGTGRAVTGEPSGGLGVQPDPGVGRDPVGGVVVVAGELPGGGVQDELVAVPLVRRCGCPPTVEVAGRDVDEGIGRPLRIARPDR
jgi:hypothetical protein